MKNWHEVKRLTEFVGCKVVEVATDEDELSLYYGLVLENSKGGRYIVWFLSDEEGNDPGSFDVQPILRGKLTPNIQKEEVSEVAG